jgi:hypothetical protein
MSTVVLPCPRQCPLLPDSLALRAQRSADLASAEFRELVHAVMAAGLSRHSKTDWRRGRDAALKNPNVRLNRLSALRNAMAHRLGPWSDGGTVLRLKDVKSYLTSEGHYSLFDPDVAELLRELRYEYHRTSGRRLWVRQ